MFSTIHKTITAYSPLLIRWFSLALRTRQLGHDENIEGWIWFIRERVRDCRIHPHPPPHPHPQEKRAIRRSTTRLPPPPNEGCEMDDEVPKRKAEDRPPREKKLRTKKEPTIFFPESEPRDGISPARSPKGGTSRRPRRHRRRPTPPRRSFALLPPGISFPPRRRREQRCDPRPLQICHHSVPPYQIRPYRGRLEERVPRRPQRRSQRRPDDDLRYRVVPQVHARICASGRDDE